ncbi:zinc finger protein ZFP2-like isoform X2 [Episyrphus balteatus]|uniref:zinc finger protein ZFP2-like isoform X2 n=1 Tax=Episyrphus balteatus TaxID=286459 RepID=UPI002485644E|nr:zinc finger protein ZFP2-like isoform X2 [Episyrphus balteatus]
MSDRTAFECNMEIIEEDFIVDETAEPMYASDIKQENDFQSEEIIIFDGCEQYAYTMSTENKNKELNNSNAQFDSNTDQDFSSNDQHSEENSFTLEVFEQSNENISDNEDITLIESNHIKLETTDIICHSCECTFPTMQDAESHQCVTKPAFKNVIVCETCQAVLDKDEDLENHQCKIVEEKKSKSLFSCDECPKSFSLINMLRKHQSSHKQKKIEKTIKIKKKNEVAHVGLSHCSICNTTFSSQKNLKLHSKMHVKTQTKTIEDALPIGSDSRDENKFFCEICSKSFNHSLLLVHQNMHQNIEEHNCSICNRQFENQVSYDMHMQLHADQPTKERSAQGTKPGAKFACNYCGKEFLRPHEKVKHERIHTGEKPHECEVCGKSFRVSYSLTLHLRTHTDIRPFVCAQCNKRFKSYAVYSHHLNTHSEDRPYKCPMCPKSFRTSVQLCGHKNSHTKPYNCPECNRPFSSLYAVKMHMKTHNKANKSNENLKHRCDTCGAVYARMFALRFHMKEQHSKDLLEYQNSTNDGESPDTTNYCKNEDEVSTQAILPGEEIIIDNFQPEEIVTDWLIQK